jgi:predicted signal transduction protein with EAL and GGDEF domain
MLVPSLASRSWRAQFTAVWTVLAAFAVGAVASLDGGLESPLILLLFLPVPYAVLVFTPWVVGVCGFATLASGAFVVMTDSSTRLSLGGVLVLFAVLAGASVLSIAASVNRTRRERSEQILVEELAKLAATDGLTGCAVHRVFYQRFEEEIARSVRNGHPLSLMMIDVDCFKSVNDTYGHSVGDDVLAAVGVALRAHARSFDLKRFV